MLSPDDTHVFVLVAERAAGAKHDHRAELRDRDRLHRGHPGRTNVGDTQDRRLLAVLNLKTGKTVWADGSFAPPVAEDRERGAGDTPDAAAPDSRVPAGKRGARDPLEHARGFRRRQARRGVRALGRQQGSLARDARCRDGQDPRHRSRCTTRRGCAKRAAFGGSGVEFLPDNKRIWFLSERDGWMHLYTLDVAVDGAKPMQLTTGKWEIARRRAVARRQEVLRHDHRGASGRAPSLFGADRRRRAHEDHVDDRIERGGGLARRVDARRWSTPTAPSRRRCT